MDGQMDIPHWTSDFPHPQPFAGIGQYHYQADHRSTVLESVHQDQQFTGYPHHQLPQLPVQQPHDQQHIPRHQQQFHSSMADAFDSPKQQSPSAKPHGEQANKMEQDQFLHSESQFPPEYDPQHQLEQHFSNVFQLMQESTRIFFDGQRQLLQLQHQHLMEQMQLWTQFSPYRFIQWQTATDTSSPSPTVAQPSSSSDASQDDNKPPENGIHNTVSFVEQPECTQLGVINSAKIITHPEENFCIQD